MPAAGLPIALEIVDETRVVETEGLLPRIGRHVAAISRQRLLRDAQRLAGGGGAGHSRPPARAAARPARSPRPSPRWGRSRRRSSALLAIARGRHARRRCPRAPT